MCGNKRDIVKPLSLLNRFEFCRNACEGAMERTICAPAVRGDYAGYDCPVTGKWIEGKRAHEENLKETGCRILEPGEHQQNQRRREQDEADLEARVEHTAESFVHNLPTEKREQLAIELRNGADTTTVRSTPTSGDL